VSVAEALAAVGDRLASAGVPSPEVDARLLVRHVLGWSQTRLVTHGGDALESRARAALWELTRRRAAREPLQLILGTVGFRHLDLLVRPGVFLPRPETEVLAGEALARTPPGGVVVEPCTGTGAVACAIAAERPDATVVAADVSADAVALARENAARAGVTLRVVQGDLLDPVPRELRGSVDVLVTNPPYVAEAEMAAVEPEVKADPRTALVAGPTGYEVTDRLLALAPAWLRQGGWLLMETAESRAAETADRARTQGLVEASVIPDLTGRDRIVVARAGGRRRG